MCISAAGLDEFSDVRAEHDRSFGVPFGVDLDQPAQAGWGIIFHPDTPQDVRSALGTARTVIKLLPDTEACAPFRSGQNEASKVGGFFPRLNRYRTE